MAFQSCPRIASVAIHGTSNGKQIANILHAEFSSGYGASDISNLAATVALAVTGVYEPLMSANLLLTDVTVTGLNAPNDFQSVATLGGSAGSAAGIPLPANNSLVATFRSALTGRSARGRVYSFPTGSSNVAATGGDLYTTAYGAAIETFWGAISAAIATASWVHVILSRRSLGFPRVNGVGFPVTSITTRNDVADSQRRRLPKGH